MKHPWNLTRLYVLAVLKGQRGDRAGAARILGMGVRTLNMKLRRWGVPDVRREKDSTDV